MAGHIIVADDHPLFHEGMLSVLQRLLPEARIKEAGNLARVLRLASKSEQPDPLILGLRSPGLTRIEMPAGLRRWFSRTTLIVVSVIDDPQLIGEVINTGTDGFLGRSITPEELGQAILAIRAGKVLVRYGPLGLLPLQPNPHLEGLTECQLDILRLLTQGKSNKKIGRALDISRYTARTHVSSLLRALGMPPRTTAVAKYRATLGHGGGEQQRRWTRRRLDVVHPILPSVWGLGPNGSRPCGSIRSVALRARLDSRSAA